MALIVILLVISAFILPGLFIAYPILKPLFLAAAGRTGTRQFAVIDLLWLALMLQVPLAAVGVLRQAGADETVYFAAIPLGFVFIYAWLRGAWLLARLQVHGFVRRGVLLVIVLPAAILGSVIGMYVGVVMLAAMANGFVEGALIIPIAIAAMPLFVLGVRWLGRWVISGSDDPVIAEKFGLAGWSRADMRPAVADDRAATDPSAAESPLPTAVGWTNQAAGETVPPQRARSSADDEADPFG